jgi:hypothetical protein
MTQLNVKVIEKFTAKQTKHFSKEAVSGLSIEQFNLIPVTAIKGFTAANLGGLAPEVIFAMGFDILNTVEITEVKKLSVADTIKIVSNLNTATVQVTDIEPFLPSYVKIDRKTGKLKFKKGKVKLPKHVRKQVLPATIVLPDLPDFNISLNLGGSFTKQTILTELNQTLVTSGLTGFTFQQQDSGILVVEGQGRKFSFIPTPDGLEQLAEDTPTTPSLRVTQTGHYEFITASNQKLVLTPVPGNIDSLLEIIGETGQIEINKYGKTRLQWREATSGTFRQIVGLFGAEVKTAPAGAVPGITFTGTPGIDEIAICVHKDGTQQTIYPSILDREISELTAPQVTGNQRLKYQYHANGAIHFNFEGFRWKAIPELQITTVAKRKKHWMRVLKPTKLVELITTDGQRQLIHIEKIGEAVSDDSE